MALQENRNKGTAGNHIVSKIAWKNFYCYNLYDKIKNIHKALIYTDVDF